MPCLLLHGDSNIGKTKITAKFRRAHPNEFDERSGVERCSVVSMQMPPTPDQHRFYSGLLFELGAPHNAAAGLASLERLARDILRRVSPRMLVVDEVHHLLAGSYREQRAALNLLKFLANDLQVSMVLVGTRDAVLALQTDTQMMSRYKPFEIPRWRESDGLRRLLAAFERVLPLRKPSDLARREIVQFVLSATGGLTGEISSLLNNAAELAIPNIPVFGDAEWIGVFTASENHGSLNFEAQGSIDVPTIRDQVADILEGGRDAFMQRKAKYEF
jgi:hypothetical protein